MTIQWWPSKPSARPQRLTICRKSAYAPIHKYQALNISLVHHVLRYRGVGRVTLLCFPYVVQFTMNEHFRAGKGLLLDLLKICIFCDKSKLQTKKTCWIMAIWLLSLLFRLNGALANTSHCKSQVVHKTCPGGPLCVPLRAWAPPISSIVGAPLVYKHTSQSHCPATPPTRHFFLQITVSHTQRPKGIYASMDMLTTCMWSFLNNRKQRKQHKDTKT